MSDYKQNEHRLGVLRERKRQLENLLDHPGFQDLKSVVQSQIMLRRQTAFNLPIAKLEDCFSLATLRGEVAGLISFESLVVTMIEDIAVAIQDLQLEMKGHEE